MRIMPSFLHLKFTRTMANAPTSALTNVLTNASHYATRHLNLTFTLLHCSA